MKYLVIASKKDKAGMNIAGAIGQFNEVDIYFVDSEVVYEENLDLERIGFYDFVIFVSRHESREKMKTISVHAPGNWREAKFGGADEKVCKSSALFMKFLFNKLGRHIDDLDLKGYNLTMEATHHGPLINKPCVFVEIGSTECEWRDKRAGFVVAKAVLDAVNNFKGNRYNEVAVGIGGPHYCPNFNKIQRDSNVAFSHVIPLYSLPLTEEIIMEAIDKTDEEVDFVVLDWKGLGRKEQREQVLEVLDRNYVEWKKVSEIGR